MEPKLPNNNVDKSANAPAHVGGIEKSRDVALAEIKVLTNLLSIYADLGESMDIGGMDFDQVLEHLTNLQFEAFAKYMFMTSS